MEILEKACDLGFKIELVSPEKKLIVKNYSCVNLITESLIEPKETVFERYDVYMYLEKEKNVISTASHMTYEFAKTKTGVNIFISVNGNAYEITVDHQQISEQEIARAQRLLELHDGQFNEFDIIISTAQSIINLQNS